MTLQKNAPLATCALAVLTSLLAIAPLASAQWNEQVLYSFQGGVSDGFWPAGSVVFDKAGNLYGATTGAGGDNCAPIGNECGLVYELSPPVRNGDPWIETILYQFQGKFYNDGSVPEGGLIIDSIGNLYGTTAYGGAGDCILLGVKAGCGTVYELSPPQQKGGQWTKQILYSFRSGKDGYFPSGNLTFDAKGNLYGATLFGGGKGTSCDEYYGGNCGTVFEVSPPKQKGGKWTEKVLHSFAGGLDGANPNGGLIRDREGAVYGMTQTGGFLGCQVNQAGCGVVFKLTPPRKKEAPWKEGFLHVFTYGTDGAGPHGGVISDGTAGGFYGATTTGGTGSHGVIFHLLKRGGKYREAILYNFTGGNDGGNPSSPTLDRSGRLYGAASYGGGSGSPGTVFRLEKKSKGSWDFEVLYSFASKQGDGAGPFAGVVLEGSGELYGTTSFGGAGNACRGGCGTVFEVAPTP